MTPPKIKDNNIELSKQRIAKVSKYGLGIDSNIALSIAYSLIAIAEKLDTIIDNMPDKKAQL